MPRPKKVVEIAPPDNGEPDQPKGEALPPLEDFVRKMSNSFSENIILPDLPQDDDEEEGEDEE